jgi:hypothetical protein
MEQEQANEIAISRPYPGIPNHHIIIDLSRYNDRYHHNTTAVASMNQKRESSSISVVEHEIHQATVLDTLQSEIHQHAVLCITDKHSPAYPYTLPNSMYASCYNDLARTIPS